jgi:transcriptional regulator with XRE-family HTH domain
MKTKLNEPAFREFASLEEDLSITAGTLDTASFFRKLERQREERRESPFGSVLGMFLNLARREKGLSLDALAQLTGATFLELHQAEEGERIPEPRIISKLARTLEVPPGKLMQLAGHVEALDKSLADAACAFAASASTKPLAPDEREALEEFVKALAQ